MIETTCPHCGWTVFEGGSHVCVEKLKPEQVAKWKLEKPQTSDPTTLTIATREKLWLPAFHKKHEEGSDGT